MFIKLGVKRCTSILVALVCCLGLTGCKTELYGDLSEKEANEMYAILYNAGISVEKETQKGRVVTLSVEERQSAVAIQLLKSHGYPKDQFTNLGDVFSKDGIISSPVEEQARLIYALSQEVSSTLSQIDGVLTARVHVVMPEKKEFEEQLVPSSASVFLKHTSDAKVDKLAPKIKELVANSIHGLNAKQVSVAFFSAQSSFSEDTMKIESGVLGVGRVWLLVGLVILLLLGGGGFGYYYMNKQKSALQSQLDELSNAS